MMNFHIKKSRIGIVVPSCDKYSDLWPYFFNNFYKYWYNCPLDIYLISNEKNYSYNNLININIGKDISWSDNLKKGLARVKNQYIFLILDDLILNKKISNTLFDKIFKWVTSNNPNCLRLHISNKPNYYDTLVGKIPLRSPYKNSLMPSIWNKNFLYNSLKENESAWDFEIEGTKRAFKSEGFFSLYKSFIHYDNSVIKGKWQRPLIKKLNIKNSSRPKMNLKEQFLYNIMVCRSKIFNLLPNYIKLKFKKL